MSKTCYIRLVDGQPTQTRYTGLSDITRSIEVSMEFKTTRSTQELVPISVPFVDVSTCRTFLRREPGIDKNNGFTDILGFVSQELFKLIERPVVEFPVKLCSTSFLYADLGKVFKCEYCGGRLNYLLRDAVINVSHKPSFSTGEFLQLPFSGSSAFGLQFSSEMRILSSRILHSRRIEKCVIGTHCDVHDTPVNTKDGLFFDQIRSSGFHLTMQVKCLIVSVKRQSGRFDLPIRVLPIILRNRERGFNPAVTGGDSCISGLHINPDNSLIVPHRRKFFTKRFKLTFHRFQRFASTISCTLYQRGREIRNSLTNVLISSLMAVNFACRMGIETPFRANIERHGIISHSLQERSATIRRNVQFQLDCPNHNHICTPLDYLPFGGEWCGAIHPVTKVAGFLAPRS